MQTLTLYISSLNLTDELLANIKAYLSKWVHIFGYKIPVNLEYHFVEREFGSYAKIDDHFPKYVITMDKRTISRNGIVHYNLLDFLLGRVEL